MVKVYMDQSAYSQLLNQSPDDWRQTKVGQVLLDAQQQGRAEVWASPSNVLETAQATEIRRRRDLAGMILSLIDAKRMWYGNEYERIRDFLGFVDLLAPGFWRQKEYFRHHAQAARRIWLGALALIACPQDLDLSELISSMQKVKTTSRLLHARFARNPQAWIDQMVTTVEERRTTQGDPFEDLIALSIPQMEAEIATLEGEFTKLTKKDLEALNKNRKRLASAYGAMEIGRLLQTIFYLPMELIVMLDVRPVVRNWDGIKKQLCCDSLPKEVATAEEAALLTDVGHIQAVLQHLIYAVANANLLSISIGYEVVLRELQRCINHLTIPSGGLTFDADHAVSLMWCDVFISSDRFLVDGLKAISKQLADRSQGKRFPSIVTTPEQLLQAIEDQHQRVKGLDPADIEILA